jgi:predicted AAA+ superfamily ATPase
MTEIIEILEKQNPWWTNKEFKIGIERKYYLEQIKKYLSTSEIILINGVRRSGKTTLLYQFINQLITRGVSSKDILFVNFDEEKLSNIESPIKKVMEIFCTEIAKSEEQLYLFFDEIQSVKNWERLLKNLYDEKKYKIIVSGSSSYLLNKSSLSLISGRYLKITVYPLSFEEFIGFNGVLIKDKLDLISKKNSILTLLKDYLFYGGFPLITIEKDLALKEEILKSYYESILYRDILMLHNIRQKSVMKEIIHYLFSNIASPYSYKNLTNLFSADFSTVKDYISYLEESLFFFEISIFSYSLKTQSRNNKKIYCIDNGLKNSVSFKFSEDYGKLAENLAFIELKRKGNEIYYWKNKTEVDFVIKNKNNSIEGINVCYSDEVPEREIISLIELKKTFSKCSSLMILTKSVDKEEQGIRFLPLWKWLLNNNSLNLM